MRFTLSSAVLILSAVAACGQNTVPARFVGSIVSIRSDAAEIDIKADAGSVYTVKLSTNTVFQRVAPGEKNLKNAEPIEAAALKAADRVLVAVAEGTAEARRIVVMPAEDIAKRNEADRADWTQRGVSGIVTAKKNSEISLKLHTLQGESAANVTVASSTKFRRYAPDSVKFADARPSSLDQVSVGDQVRARGVKSADGLRVAAEEVVFGTFLTTAGAITAVDTAANEITIKQMGSGRRLVVKVTADSQVKAMPAFPAMGAGMPAGRPMMGGRPPDLAQMLEFMPAAKIGDLKAGETVVVSSTKGGTAGQVTAIMLLANADMLIQMASAQARSRGGREAANSLSPGVGSGVNGLSGGLSGLDLPGMTP